MPENEHGRGAIIGNVLVYPENIFNLEDPQENKALHRLANAVHVRTSNSDGSLRSLDLERPFYSLDSRWSTRLTLLEDEHTGNYGSSFVADGPRRLSTTSWIASITASGRSN
jgi:hypothetical protein